MNTPAFADHTPGLVAAAHGDRNIHVAYVAQYSLTLRFSPARQLGADATTTFDEAPDFFTALREQLGLKLEREKKMVPVLIIDHIERPTSVQTRDAL